MGNLASVQAQLRYVYSTQNTASVDFVQTVSATYNPTTSVTSNLDSIVRGMRVVVEGFSSDFFGTGNVAQTENVERFDRAVSVLASDCVLNGVYLRPQVNDQILWPSLSIAGQIEKQEGFRIVKVDPRFVGNSVVSYLLLLLS